MQCYSIFFTCSGELKGRKVRKLPVVDSLPYKENKSPNHNRWTSLIAMDFATSTPRHMCSCDVQKTLREEKLSSADLPKDVGSSPKQFKTRLCPLTPKNSSTEVNKLPIRGGNSYSIVSSRDTEKLFQCSFCCKNFKYFSNVKSHLQVVHKRAVGTPEAPDLYQSNSCKDNELQCDICFRHFKYATNLRTHRLVHSYLD